MNRRFLDWINAWNVKTRVEERLRRSLGVQSFLCLLPTHLEVVR